jgi:hypothetical protein
MVWLAGPPVTNHPMAAGARPLTVRASELARLRAAVIDCTGPEEQQACERLLGQLAFLETGPGAAAGAHEVTFSAPPDSAELARRALERMRTELFRRRRRT